MKNEFFRKRILPFTTIMIWILTAGLLFGQVNLEADEENTENGSNPETENGGQTEIEADKGSMDFNTNTATFEGNVIVKDEDVSMTSDMLVAKLDSDNQIKTLEATDNVVITQKGENRVARSNYALYTVENRTVVLMDNPRLEIGDSVLSNAYKIIYDMDSDLITTEGREGARTKITIPSGKSPETEPETGSEE